MSADGVRVRVRNMPHVGIRIPGTVPRAAVGVIGVLLCVLCLPAGGWLVVGLVVTAAAVVFPERLAAWLLIVYLGASQLPHEPSGVTWEFLLLLAGVHLLHVLATQAAQAPWRGWAQLAAFKRPLLRFAAIQAPAQIVAALTLAFLAPGSKGGRTRAPSEVAVVGIVALVALALLLAVPLLRQHRR